MYLPFSTKEQMMCVAGTVAYLEIERKMQRKIADIKAGRRPPDKRG